MKIFRFMSKNEFDKLIQGEILKNNKIHQGNTNSIGFCFMKVEDNTPEFAYEFLSGIVSDDVCVVFETNKKLTKSYGIYANPYGNFFSTITEDEYCIKEYNLKDFKIIKMAIPKYDEEKWKWETDLNKIKKNLDKIEKDIIQKEKEQKIKNKLIENYEREKSIEFYEFYNQINKKRKLEIKIGNKYYTIPCIIDEINGKQDMLRKTVNVKFETWF